MRRVGGAFGELAGAGFGTWKAPLLETKLGLQERSFAVYALRLSGFLVLGLLLPRRGLMLGWSGAFGWAGLGMLRGGLLMLLWWGLTRGGRLTGSFLTGLGPGLGGSGWARFLPGLGTGGFGAGFSSRFGPGFRSCIRTRGWGCADGFGAGGGYDGGVALVL